MQINIDLAKLLAENNRIDYYGRIESLLEDCESLRECKKDYWTYEQYALMLEHAVTKLRRECAVVKEDIKHDKR